MVEDHLGRSELTMPLGRFPQVASERHFFDLVKETLQSMSKPGHDAWAEFLKFLNLYSNDVLNRKDMLAMLEDVFGKHKVRTHTPHQALKQNSPGGPSVGRPVS